VKARSLRLPNSTNHTFFPWDASLWANAKEIKDFPPDGSVNPYTMDQRVAPFITLVALVIAFFGRSTPSAISGQET
jgi:hypothetical protein